MANIPEKCSRCRAPIDWDDGAAFTKCEFCGFKNYLTNFDQTKIYEDSKKFKISSFKNPINNSFKNSFGFFKSKVKSTKSLVSKNKKTILYIIIAGVFTSIAIPSIKNYSNFVANKKEEKVDIKIEKVKEENNIETTKKLEKDIEEIKIKAIPIKDELFENAKFQYLFNSNYYGAINILNDLIKKRNNSEAFLLRGIIRAVELEEFREALTDIRKAIELDDEDPNKYMAMGFLKSYALSLHEEGIEDLNKAINLDPKNSLAYLFRGYVNSYIADSYEDKKNFYENKKFRMESIEDFSKSLEYYKNEINPYYKRLYPFGFLHNIYGERGNQYFSIAFAYQDLKDKDMFKSSLETALEDFDRYIDVAPSIDEIESMNNKSKTFEYQYIKSAGNVWKGNVYSWLNKPLSACKEWKKVKKLSSYKEGWKNWNKYKYVEEGFSNFETDC